MILNDQFNLCLEGKGVGKKSLTCNIGLIMTPCW